MLTITRVVRFSASHRYWNPEWDETRNREIFGACANPFGHGHNYVLEVSLCGEPDPSTGMIIDLKQVKNILEERVLQQFDHQHLNESIPLFKQRIPTTENLVLYLRELLGDAFPGTRLRRIRLWETEDLYAEWEEDPCSA